jgi:hypothetical protein
MDRALIVAVLTIFLFSFKSDSLEEGMFPMSQLNALDLKTAGLEISTSNIYNESKPALVNALVRLGGCTGSFISDSGLIITNHHCVFSSVASASSSKNNYLENGFYAIKKTEEIKTSLPCKITISYVDVSEEVLAGIDVNTPALKKQEIISKNRKLIIEREQKANPNLTPEISEMLVGKSYTLFRYKTLDDVRLVYVPPKNIGKFGGETDNWEWPRHNGDFSIVRAYENGIPYVPEKYLEVNPSGTSEGDFTFILGYPGRTYRNQTAQFLDYQNNYVLPIIADWFDFQIEAIKSFAGDDIDMKLKYSGRLASLNNTSKNFKGKMQGLQRTDVIAQKYDNQKKLAEYAAVTKSFNGYQLLFKKNEELYARKFALARDYIYLNQLYRNGIFSGAAFTQINNESIQILTKDERAEYLDQNSAKILRQLSSYRGLESRLSLEKKLFSELLYQLSLSHLSEIKFLFDHKFYSGYSTSRNSAYRFADMLWESSKLRKIQKNNSLLVSDMNKYLRTNDELISFASKVNRVFRDMQKEMIQINAEIDAIIPRFNDIDMEMKSGSFIPDANGTLRFTYGYIRGYEPEDAVKARPYTTVNGIIEKTEGTSNPDYFLQSEFVKKMKTIEPADVLRDRINGSVVVGLLYNMDTTGGNSGSPIMDSKGRLVGVNFDRAYTATINDYAWNESYSRSIGVDIRYVLYIMKYFGKADEVLNEMGVEL